MRVDAGQHDGRPNAAPPARVIITGGASGIGRATALTLASEGHALAIIDVDAAAGEALRAEAAVLPGTLSFIEADVSDDEQVVAGVAAAVSSLGGVDALVCAAGIMRGQLEDLASLSEQAWDQVLDVNLKGAFLVARRVGPIMDQQGHGVILLVGSRAGVSVGSGSFAYGASKGGIHGLALALDRHLGPRGIRVNEVCPGDVDTPLYRRSVAEGVERGRDAAVAEEMLERAASADEVARVLAFLATDAASAVRGTVFTA